MSEKTNQDQDQKPANDVDTTIDVDALIAAEDPEFLAKLNNMSIDSSKVAVDFDGNVDIERHIHQSLTTYLKKPFEFKTNTKSVAAFWGFFLVACALLAFAWVNKDNLLHQDLFITSLEVVGGKAKSYNPITENEPFYDNPRFSKNLITMSSVHVNLRPSENSGDNPMLAFELTVEGLSSDAIVEIKDRQAEFKDMLARLSEQKTYDELVESEGKRNLCDQYRDLLNANLTRGQVRRVLLKTFIIKP